MTETKHEELTMEKAKEGVADIIMASWYKDEKSTDTAYDILSYLKSKGIIRKVEKPCEHCNGTGFASFSINGNSAVCAFCLGEKVYITYEELI